MANTFLTPSVIAQEALMLLESNMVLGNLVYRDHAKEFTGAKVGDTVSVARPASFVANEYDGATLVVQDAVESSVSLQLEKHFDTSFKVSSKQMTLEIKDFSQQLLQPAMLSIAEAIDTYVSTVLAKIGTVAPDGTAAGNKPTTIGGVASIRQAVFQNKIPRPWYGVVSPTYETSLLSIDGLMKANERGDDGEALREARMGRSFGIDWWGAHNLDDSAFTTGTQTSGAIAADAAKGALSVAYDTGAVAAGTLKVGDIVDFGTYGMYAIAAANTAVTNAGTLTFAEPLRTAIPDTTAFTVYDGGGNVLYKRGMVFNPNAITLAVVPLALPGSNQNAAYVNYRGMALRVVYDWDKDAKSDVVSIDTLCGAKMIDGALATVITSDN